MSVLHILGKDLRRHWRETALFVAVTAAWTWQQAHPQAWTWPNGKAVLPILFFVLWFFIVVRVVQGESLVGDREFWTTRPYQWDALLMAKAIFLLLVLNVPLLASQVYQLFAAGFSFSWPWIPGLLFLCLAFAACLTLPAVALASVTESLVQWILAVAGLAIFAVFVSWLPWSRLPVTLQAADQASGAITVLVVGVLLVLAIVKQYSRRLAMTTIAIMATAILASIAIELLGPIALLRNLSYPQSSGQPPIRIAIRATGPNGAREYTLTGFLPLKPSITFPIEGNATAPDTVIQVEGARLNAKGDGGWRWQSAWSKENASFSEIGYQGGLSFDIAANTAKELANRHATATVELALAVYKLSTPRRIETAADTFEIPGLARCRWPAPYLANFAPNFLECDSALRLPDLVLSRMDSGESTCAKDDSKADPLPPGHSAFGLNWDETPMPADFDLRPVRRFDFGFSGWSPAIPDPQNKGRSRIAFFCRGTPITVRIGSFSERMRMNVDLGDLGSQSPVKYNPADDPDE